MLVSTERDTLHVSHRLETSSEVLCAATQTTPRSTSAKQLVMLPHMKQALGHKQTEPIRASFGLQDELTCTTAAQSHYKDLQV